MDCLAPPESWNWTRSQITAHQNARLRNLWPALREHPLYRKRLARFDSPPTGDAWRTIPPLTKSELVVGPGQTSRLFTGEPRRYVRYHQTSGTAGRPMPIYDTAEDWRWWLDCWDHVLAAAAVTDRDVAMMAFSFGPFIGFWTANDSLVRRGALVIPGGGLSSQSRVNLIVEQHATVLLCTPSYAIRLATAAREIGVDPARSAVTRIIVAGEPGGSVPATRYAIENAWGATVIDHAGASEVGAWGFGSAGGAGLHVIETEFIAEICDFSQDSNGVPVDPGADGELVLTNPGRAGGPLLRYRTGDVVQNPDGPPPPGCGFLHLPGGIRGRADDMVVIRGVNIYPSSIEAIVRQIDPAVEYEVMVDRTGDLDNLSVRIEAPPATAQSLASMLADRLAVRVNVQAIEPGTLPCSAGKAQRWIS